MRVAVERVARGRQEDLRKVGVILVPELVAPGLVEVVDGLVAALQPRLERRVSVLRLVVRPAVFVVDLPADDRRMLAELVGQGRDDSRCRLAQRTRGGVLMTSSAVTDRCAVLLDGA